MRLRLECQDRYGIVDVQCFPNDEPELFGCPPDAVGFPVCTANVDASGQGYRAFYGWVQLVRSTDNRSGGATYELDPFALFADSPSPYCWYGLNPTLFDAPYRRSRSDMDWFAHTFLATSSPNGGVPVFTRRVVPIIGFSWGFRLTDGAITLAAVEELDPAAWNTHVPLLRQLFPRWQIDSDI